MSLDRIVQYPGERPSNEAIGCVLRVFFAGSCGPHEKYGNVPTWDTDRWFVVLRGKVADGRERWIEVWPGDDCIDIMTRQMDEFTNDVADRLARSLNKWLDGVRVD